MLLTLLAKESGMQAGTVNGTLIDCHLYTNHVDQAREQLQRKPFSLPTVELPHWTSIWDWKHYETEFVDYNHHKAIKGEVAV